MLYPCVESDVRAHGVHDNLLSDGALLTDPETVADTGPQLS